MDKKTARARARGILRGITEDEVKKWSDLALKRFLVTDLYRNCGQVFVYMSVGKEFRTGPLIARAQADGKKTAVPRVTSPVSEGARMDFISLTEETEFRKGSFGIPEPVSGEILVPGEGSVMILPGLSFTREGKRLGYGGGYYDRYLAACPSCETVVLTFEALIAEDLPADATDRSFSWLFTEKGGWHGGTCV